jgi:hypothetical protein
MTMVLISKSAIDQTAESYQLPQWAEQLEDIWDFVSGPRVPWHRILLSDENAASILSCSPTFLGGDDGKAHDYKVDHMEAYNSFGLEWPPSFDEG